jgi:hypothetical protein
VFEYTPNCSIPGCENEARYKAAAPWSDGRVSELKTYGLACDAHRDAILSDANERRAGLRLAEGEQLGPVGLYVLRPGARDAELERIDD